MPEQPVTATEASRCMGAAPSSTLDGTEHTHNTAPTRFVEVGGVRFAYRRFGNPDPLPRLQPRIALSVHGAVHRCVTDFVDR
jgi:hypothetical protein